MDLKGKHCLVTGGAGFIGSHLVDKLLERGCQVRVLDNLANGKLANLEFHRGNPSFNFLEGSVTSESEIARAVEGINAIFHLACLGVRHSINKPFENHQVNSEGTLLVLEAARKAGVERFVYCSSSEVYGTAQFVPMPESHPTHPCTVYGAAKLAGEAYARAYFKTYGMNTTVIRPFNTYGPRSHHEGDAGELIPKSIVRALSGQDILVFGDGTQTRDFTYVEDTALGLITAAESDEMIGKTLNIGSNFEIPIKQVVSQIIETTGAKVNMSLTPDRPGDVLRLYADPSQFMELSLWRPQTGFSEGLKKTIRYFKDHPHGIERLALEEAGRNW